MKKISLLLVTGIISCWIASVFAQAPVIFPENFDGNSITFTASPATAWKKDLNYYISPPNSMRGIVPNKTGDEVELLSPVYDFKNYTNVQLRFSHICKVSPQDIAHVEYRTNMGGGVMGAWKMLPSETYLGKANTGHYKSNGFNANSYSEWKGGDSLALPSSGWWKEEIFDLWFEAGLTEFQFRFVLKHGATPATQISYGWLIDNIEMTAANYPLLPPKVEFVGTYPQDTVYSVGIYTINAKIKTGTTSGVRIPWMVYTSTFDGVSVTDSILMDHVAGDSLWRAALPQFPVGTSVMYSITGKDSMDNYATIIAGYNIVKPSKGGTTAGEVEIGDGTMTTAYTPYHSNSDRNWTRSIYYAREFNPQGMGGVISNISYSSNIAGVNTSRLSIYVKATQDEIITTQTYIDPVLDGATLVWGEAMYKVEQGWNTFTFHTPFYLLPGQNLMVYWLNDDGSYVDNGGTINWHYTLQSINNNIRAYANNTALPSLGGVAVNGERPNIKVFLIGANYSENSAALCAINSPLRGQTTGNSSTPITVSLQNKGDSVLTSATIKWSVNGGQINTCPWTGNLLWDFQELVTIGNFTPRLEEYDTVLVWVSMPNEVIDNISFDDVLSTVIYGCTPSMSGTYTIGTAGDFKKIQDAINVLSLCSPLAGDITFELYPGTYNEGINLSGLAQALGGNTLTITSTTHNANDVIIKPASGVGITFSQTNNIIIKDITVDVTTTKSHAIHFAGVCRNILIRDCRLLADTAITATSNNLIYGNGGGLDSIFIIHNLLDGGYYGIYLYGAFSDYNTNICVDSNTIQNHYYYGLYLYYTKSISISYNIVLSRTANTYFYWNAIYLYYAHANHVIGNRIRQRSNGIPYPSGIYFSGQFSAAALADTALVANNEIILYITGTNYGIYMSSSRAKIINNSIYINGTGAARGIQIVDGATNYLIIKNNNIVMTNSGAFPIYLSSVANIQLYDFDYNNMYAPQYAGYAGGNMNTISAWQQAVKTDQHSIDSLPDFIDNSLHLQLSDYTYFTCMKDPSVIFDINNYMRAGITTNIGAYHAIPPFTVNATLMDISGNREGGILGETDSIKVTLINTGTTAITKATLKWEWNGTPQPDVSWTGNLLSENKTLINLGAVTYTAGGYYNVKIWIDNLDLLADNYSGDDTVSARGYICTVPLNGGYLLGTNNADFTTFREFTDRLKLCGASGDVTLSVQPATYTESVDLSDLSPVLNGYSFTLTSTTANATDVIIETTGTGIILSKSNNIVIKDITVDATMGINAIQFSGACTNVLIRDCILRTNQITANATNNNPVYATGGSLDSIRIIHNLLEGGYYGLYINGNSLTTMNTNIVVDSNIAQNNSNYGLYIYYNKCISVSYNTILSRAASAGTSWYGMLLNYMHADKIIGNRINQRSKVITNPYGISLYSQLSVASISDTTLIANNEIILTTTNAYQGIYTGTVRAKILYNSIYVAGESGQARGIYIQDATTNYCVIKYNNIVMESPAAYPISFSAFDPLRYDLDYNNMYAPIYVGYAGGNKLTISDWQQTVITDHNSLRFNPLFLDKTTSLKLLNPYGIIYPPSPLISDDIEMLSRTGVTALGAYHGFSATDTVNAALVKLLNWREGTLLGQEDTVKVFLVNLTNTRLTSATIQWSYNGVQNQVTCPVNLGLAEGDTITLGTINYSSAGYYELTAWIAGLGTLTDQNHLDDTVGISGYVCSSPIAGGVYNIGANGAYPSIEAALDRFSRCGVSGDITLTLESGTYLYLGKGMDLSNTSDIFGGYVLTITSATNNANDVIIQTDANGIRLANSNNLIIKAITVNATQGANAIQFTEACTNVIIRDCRLLTNTTVMSNTGNPVFSAEGIGLDNIFIINNLLDGGYHGIYLSGNSSVYNTNIVIDSNTFQNNFVYGFLGNYNRCISISHNTILSRTSNVATNWYAMYMSYTHADNIIGNHIRQRTNSITYPYGIYFMNQENTSISDFPLIANNEIMLYTTIAYLGMRVGYGRAKIFNNSIYIRGTGEARGIDVADATTNIYIIKNNNIFMESPNAYPIYLPSFSSTQQYDLDYNNMYAPTNVGYAGGAITTIGNWRNIVTTDKNSVSIPPDFVDNSVNLKLKDYTGLKCILLPEVVQDMDYIHRAGDTTTMGCYHMVDPLNINARLVAAHSLQQNFVFGLSDSLKVELINTGATTLTEATIAWKWNNVTRTPVLWTGSLVTNQKVIITLGEIIYNQVGLNTATAWIDNLGTLTDYYSKDDTVNLSTDVCNTSFGGTYLIGATGLYPSPDEFIRLMSICGVSGDITLNMQPGTYPGTLNLNNISSKMGNYSFTIKSTTNNAEDVIFKTTANGIVFSGNKNITIKAITVDATQGTNAIQFTGACTNILIRDCRLLTNTTMTSNIGNPIYAYAIGGLDSIFIINNLLDGGYYSIDFYGGGNVNTNIIIDSNIAQNHYIYGIKLEYYTHCISLSYNTILSRTMNATNSWYAIDIRTSHVEKLIGNRIMLRNDGVVFVYGIYFYNQQLSPFPGDTVLIANNEIMLYGNASNSYCGGIYAGSGRAKIINNSIYVKGNGSPSGIYILDAAAILTVKNNNIVMESSTAYPVYLNAITNLSRYDIDYNNMYAPQYIGYAGGNISTLPAWKRIVTTDTRSVCVAPEFFNLDLGMDLLDSTGLSCDLHLDVPDDILGFPRSQKTTIGAYHYFNRPTDVYPYAFVDLEDIYSSVSTVPLKVRIKNDGLDTLKSANIHWIYNGTSDSSLWTGFIPPYTLSNTLSIGTLNIAQNYNDLILYTTLPNGTPDTRVVNDTIKKVILLCDNLIQGRYTVGNMGDFANMKEALQLLNTCGVNGDVTLALLPGTYQEDINLNNISIGYNLTITSSTDNADDVTIETFNTGITLSQSNHITIKAITVDAIQGSNAIRFAGACQDIVIRDCKLLADPTGNSGYPVYNGIGGLDNVSIINNLIDGGYHGIHMNGSSVNMNTNLIIDSNTIQNNYYYGLYNYYSKYISISYNTVLSRISNTYTDWYGLSVSYSHAERIIGNRILQRSNGIMRPYGLYFAYQQTVSTVLDTAHIINNEIILNMTTSYAGMSLNGYAKIINNSIYIEGSGQARGMSFGVTATDNFTVKNNNIVMASPDAHPIYLSGISNLQNYNFDYNNMYAPKYVGYAMADISSIVEWKQTVTTDLHSVSTLPVFIDSETSLEMTDAVSLLCPRNDLAMEDIRGYSRLDTTEIGAYFTPKQLDATAIEITFPSLHTAGVASYPVFTVQNTGKSPITSLTVVSSNNGSLETPVVVSSINLLPLEKIEINLNAIIPILNDNTISAWITDVNGGGLDSIQRNDTARLTIYGCTGPLNGVYSIGTSGNFTTIEEVISLMKNCGANGPVTLQFKNGIHTGHLDLASVAAFMGGYPITITSENGDTALACIQSLPNTPAITLGKNANISIQKLSIRVNNMGTHAILFTDNCDNIVINGCALYADQSATSIAKCAILKNENTGQANNIRITNNYIDGGYAGIWFFGGKNGNYGTGLVIDSNIVQDHYYAGIYLRYNNNLSLSHNTVLSKGASSSITWYALALYNNNGTITANRVMQRGTTITIPYGIYASYHNQYLTQDTGLIANNEIIVRTTGAYNGMHITNSHLDIIHNSIYIKGSGRSRGVYIEHSSANLITLKNNNIVMESSTAYPVYLSSVADMSRYDIDYNNMYASDYIAYAGGNIATLTAWRQTVPTDKHSVKVLPNFVDTSISLKLADNAYLVCPFDVKVPLTIDGQSRQTITSMGAYTHVNASFDFMLQNITYLPTEVVKGQRVPVSVKVVNMGNTIITNAVLRWSVNDTLQPSVPWTAPTPLAMYANDEIDVGMAIVPDAETMNIKVWIENLNNTGSPDMIRWNDTINGTSTLIPLGWYTEPFLKDTINTLSFHVYAVIREETGALTVTTPTLHITTIAADKTLSDSFFMTYENGQWHGIVTNQYYGSKVIYTLTVSDTVGNTIVLQDSTVITYIQGSEIYNDYNLSITYLDNGLKAEELCSPDYSTVSVSIANTGIHDYDFSNSNLNISLRLTTPVVFNVDTVITTRTLLSGEIMKVELTKLFPIMVSGEYNIKVWTGNSSDVILYDDTLLYSFVSGRWGLPIDEDFSNGMPTIFENIQGNTSTTWQLASQGTGADTAVKPVYGSQMLSFHGSRGTMVQMRTKRLDLSSTLSPALDLWYFHDTIPSEDYTDVRVTIDGGLTNTTILSLTKYDATYGWKRYTVDLPLFAINQCVILLFEAMEKSINSDVTQYIDRIRVTAKQDIAISSIFTTDYSICDLQSKEWKVVVSNLTDPVLDFSIAPTTLTLEITGKTNQTFTQQLQTGSISGFSSATFTLGSNFNLDTGTYIAKAYINANPEDNNQVNDTLVSPIVINPRMSVQLIQVSGTNACLAGEMEIWQEVVLTNTGNMDLYNIGLTLQIDTGNINPSPYVTIGETFADTIHVGESLTYTFNRSYAVPWYATYYMGITAYTLCDATLVNAKDGIVECVDTKDLYLVSIDNPSTGKDKAGDAIQVSAKLLNRSDHDNFAGLNITVLVENSQRVQTAKFTETTGAIGTLATVNHNFTNTYIVPNDTIYYLTVYIDHYENYPNNDTITIKRTTDYVGINTVETNVFVLNQNIPNPANDATRIDYSVPEAGEVVFHVHSISGQLLYSKTIEAKRGTNSIELNTTTFAAGVYFYSMEYKGQRQVKQLIISN
jgi:hypothetical protein